MPEPLLPVAIVAKSKADEDKLSQGLGRLVAEDPTLRLENNAETHQLVLWCMGEAHADVLLDRLRNRYGVERRDGAACGCRCARRSPARRRATAGTSSSPAATASTPSATSRSSRCRPAAGFEFVDKVVGGAVPRQFIPSVEKGVRTQMERGVARRLPGGRHPGHPVRRQGALASTPPTWRSRPPARWRCKEAAKAARSHMLEPVDEVSVLVADEYVGAVMSDLSDPARPGASAPSRSAAAGHLVRAEVPQMEITRYAVDLRSISHGTGTFSRSYARHEPMPSQLAAKLAGRERCELTVPTADDVAERIFAARPRNHRAAVRHLGDRLGLYRAVADLGEPTAAEVAARSGVHERVRPRVARAASGHRSADGRGAADARRFAMPDATREVLLDPTSLNYLAPLARMFAASAATMPELLTAYRTGGGVSWDDFGPDARESQADDEPALVRAAAGRRAGRAAGGARRPEPAGAPDRRPRLRRRLVQHRARPRLPGATVDGYDVDGPSVAARHHPCRRVRARRPRPVPPGRRVRQRRRRGLRRGLRLRVRPRPLGTRRVPRHRAAGHRAGRRHRRDGRGGAAGVHRTG